MRAEDLGFDSVWMEEHHSVVDHYWPSPLTVLAGFATRTSRMLLGTDIVVAPFHHPVRLAEDVAHARRDVERPRRPRGGHRLQARRVRSLRRRAREARRALRGAARDREGALDPGVVRRSRARTTRSRGGSSPSPCTKPHPPLWIGGWGELTLRRAATLADNWIPGPTADLARLLNGKRQFLDNRAAAGRTAPIAEWPLTRDVIIADTDARGARARRAAHHGLVPAGVRRRLEASVHRRVDRHRPRHA